ncbi:phage tail protein [Desulfovibrio subterraneus]|uniref:Tail fiber protein n=1 Tax=Desulfovibrio subterraneus TaxID=2718620 RepID=A0A7J0BJF8_9BACT|nr:phage tail protein [Desulfovibrio subterraneus]GFM33275.1 tail fiber protein [Desulfovibrio subterraneus]
MPNYYTLLTNKGKAKLAAAQNGTPVQITEFALGDGNGSDIVPSEAMVALVREVHRRPVNSIYIHPQNPSWTVAEVVVPQDVGGFTVREVGLYDADGDLFAIGGYPTTYKPLLDSGVGKELCLRAVLAISNASTIKLTIDPSVVTATREFVDRAMAMHNNSPDAHGEAFQALAGHIQDKDDPHATLPPGGETGQVIIKQEDGSLAWGTVAGMPVGTLHFPSTGKPDPGSVAVNVKQKFLRTVYPQLVARVLADGGYLATEEAWDAAAATNEGSCGRYALTDTHIILPCYKHYFSAAQEGVAGKEAGDWAGEELLAHHHNNGVGDYEVSHNIYGVTAEDVPGEATRALQSYNYVPTFQGLTSTTGGAENHVKRSYVLPCIKVADVAVNAAQVDMLALAAQVAAINGDKVDKGDVEYRSIVELKGSRGAAGTWTIPDLIVGKPLFISLTDTSDDGVLYRVISGTLDAVTTSTSRYHGMASRANFTSVTPSSFVLVPTAPAIEIYIQSIQTGATLRAYQ